MIFNRDCQHLTSNQRTRIRSSKRTIRALAITYGVSEKTIELVKRTAQPKPRLILNGVVIGGGGGGVGGGLGGARASLNGGKGGGGGGVGVTLPRLQP